MECRWIRRVGCNNVTAVAKSIRSNYAEHNRLLFIDVVLLLSKCQLYYAHRKQSVSNIAAGKVGKSRVPTERACSVLASFLRGLGAIIKGVIPIKHFGRTWRCSHDRRHHRRRAGSFSCWDGGGTGGCRRRPHRRPATISRTVAEHIEGGQSSRIDSVDELSVRVFEDPANLEPAPDCTAGTRRGERPGRLCAVVASTRDRLSFDGWTRHRGCDTPSSTRRVVCSAPQLRYKRGFRQFEAASADQRATRRA